MPSVHRSTVQSLLLNTSSPALLYELERARAFAAQNEPIAIYGPTGSGKSLIMEYIIANSPRSKAARSEVLLSSISDDVGLSDLFGHRKGAFTSAVANREGLCRQAAGGTLILDEINKTSLQLQGRLLELVEHGRIRAVGSDVTEAIDCRVLAATNVRLEEAVRAGLFLDDLRYRLSTFTVELPPLQLRKEDMPKLVRTFADGFATSQLTTSDLPDFPPEAIARMQEYHWPGNLRELQSFVRKVSVLSMHLHLDLQTLVSRELNALMLATPRAGSTYAPVSTRHKVSPESALAAISIPLLFLLASSS